VLPDVSHDVLLRYWRKEDIVCASRRALHNKRQNWMVQS
jgi:hypothetical protein